MTVDGLLYVPADEDLRRDLVKSRHDSLLAGHPGHAKTLELVTRDYWWPSMTKYINRYVDGCDMCQRTKPRFHKPSGFLSPLPIPQSEWTDISYDFIVKLPTSKGFDSILTVVDRFTKRAHFIACNEAINAQGTADLFVQNVWKHHSTPLHTVSDSGPQFNNQFLRRLYERLGIEPSFSTAYHPQSDGRSKRVNQAVEQFLRLYCDHQQDDWVDLLPMAEFAWNNTVNSSTGVTPFYADLKRHPTFTTLPSSNVQVPAADDYAQRIHNVQEEVKSMLKIAHDQQKEFADRRRTEEVTYQVGDKVWLSRRNIKTQRPSDKLDYRYLGPYTISHVVSPLAYRLSLPSTM